MGKSKKMPGLNSNMEPLGFHAKNSSYGSSSVRQEQDSEYHPHSRSPSRSRQTFPHVSSTTKSPSSHYQRHSRGPQFSSHYRLRSRSPNYSRAAHVRSRSPHSFRYSQRFGSYQELSSSSFYTYQSSHHKGFTSDRDVSNSSYYRPSYAFRDTRIPSKSNGQLLSFVSTYNLGESLDTEETIVKESWAELASCKHKEFIDPSLNSTNSSSPMEQSWVEIASRKHKELMAIAAANITTSIQTPLAGSLEGSQPLDQSAASERQRSTVNTAYVDSVRDARYSFDERTKPRQAEGSDIQRQISSLLYPRKPKTRPPSSVKTKVGTETNVKREDIGPFTLFELSAKHPRSSSIESMSVPVQEIHPQNDFLMSEANQIMHPSRRILLNTSPPPIQSSENLYIQADSPVIISPPKIKINTETLQTKIQELRRASFASKRPRPIPSIMDESFLTNGPFQSDPYANEPVIPTHWQD
ncbi:a3c20c3a-509d-4a89-96d1-48a49f5dfcd5 [Sclerotinia trifoliorum]|uniref:A3c20c3a-509d-4a89-96d1-48a49f5dfcd5 n=1 Tax=Sclerotinia trifoliorum TaxID=28548 RepID=A0A8H2ZQ55_9HELO|nr:a3c20c3a-509d-4a89-96d1-48a49f5dfcd5 [Sclerotinia trifoliorum]